MMIEAAKSDGTLNDAKREKLTGQLGGDSDAEKAAFLRAEMAKPVHVDALVIEMPSGLGPQVYVMSLLAIDLASQAEAEYLRGVFKGLGMDPASITDVHARRGVPSRYT